MAAQRGRSTGQAARSSRIAAGASVKRAGDITARVNGRGEVEWCSDWAGLLWLALKGHLGVKLSRQGEVVWAA